MTFKNSFGIETNTVLLRLNTLLQNGYSVDLSNDVVYYRDSDSLEEGEPSEVVSLIHTFKRELDLFLYPDGLINSQTPTKLTEENPDDIRIHEEEHEKFVKFVSELPKVNFYHKIFSFWLR